MRLPTLPAVIRPFTFGLALAYALTGFVDLPAPVSLGEQSKATAQGAVGGDEALLVAQENILRLGSPLSMRLYGEESRFDELGPDYGNWSVEEENPWKVRGWVAPE